MILYKYTDMKTADLIIKNATVKFSKATSLNDPFELSGMHYHTKNPVGNMAAKYLVASQLHGILSLTRNPLNPLMWAHYAKGKKIKRKDCHEWDSGNHSHAGLVFGIDVNEAQLNCNLNNFLPAKYGSVIYTATKPSDPFKDSENWDFLQTDFSFNSRYLEALQRIFLYKSSHWAYEEEVRIVKHIAVLDNEIFKIDARSCFKEVYIGIRNSRDYKYLISTKRKINKHLPACSIFVCDYDQSEWNFRKLTIEQALNRCR